MTSISKGNIKMAWSSISANRWRSILTVLGIVIGVFAVVSIVSIGEGVKHQVSAQINGLGQDLITIRPGKSPSGSPRDAFASLRNLVNLNQNSILTDQDVTAVQNASGVKTAVALHVLSGNVKSQAASASPIVIAASSSLSDILNQQFAYGGFFTTDDDQIPVAVIGENIATTLFPGQVPLGRAFTFRGQQFVVRGQFDQFVSPPLSLDVDFNNTIFIPEQVGQNLDSNNLIYEILVRPTNPADTTSTASNINKQLLKLHGGAQNFSVLTQHDSVSATSNVLDILTSLIGGAAAVSLIVGGVGIMNSMVVAVTERTQEIGIRKAVGATNRQILNQFLTEALLLSIIGGLLGVIFSLLANAGLRIFTSLQPAVDWQISLLALLMSTAIGLLFGITPALKAARKDPINALRYQ